MSQSIGNGECIVDLEFENHGSVMLIRPLTELATEWLAQHIDPDAQWFGNALACEPRYVDDIYCGAEMDGLVCMP